jgi:hypothetical protein
MRTFIAWGALLFLACGSQGNFGGDAGDGGGPDVTGNDVVIPPTCSAPKLECNGQCIDVTNDTNNCGACGNACSTCCSGHCVTSPNGCDFAITYVDPNILWQSGGDYVQVKGKGFAPGMKVWIDDGRAAVLVKDAQTAVIHTPPHVVATVDVKIDVGGQTAITKSIFKYVSAGLTTPWTEIQMSSVRGEFPSVAAMQDGRVLVANGVTTPDQPSTAVLTADIFSRSNNTNAPASNQTSIGRWRNAAVTMLDGRVLVVGNACDGAACSGGNKIDIFDPATNTFSPSKALLDPNLGFWTRGALLVDGRVIITSYKTNDVDVYDPSNDSMKLYAATPVQGGYPTRLRDGTMLLIGDDDYNGDLKCAVFDSDVNSFTPVGSMKTATRAQFTAHTLPSGKVIVLGGGQWPAALASIELYDPTAKTFSVAPYVLTTPRDWHASALVRDGTVIVIGGYTGAGCGATDTVDQVDPVAASVSAFAKIPHQNTELNAVTLIDGSVLVVGGGACGSTQALPYLDFLPGVVVPRPPPPN